MNDLHDEFADLLGAYALDAVEPDERERIELHLLDCPRCRAEVAEHREVAAFLAQSGAPAPDGVWDRIVAELAPPAPPLRLRVDTPVPPHAVVAPVSPTGAADDHDAVVTPIGAARRSRLPKGVLAVVAAAACIVAVLGFIAVDQSNRLDRMESALDRQSLEGMANAAVADSEVLVRLEGAAGKAEAVVAGDGQGYLIMDGMPAPGDGNLYQLWGQVDGTVLSLGTFGAGSSVVPFSVDPARLDDISLFAVTEERAPGVVASQNDPVMAGTA